MNLPTAFVEYSLTRDDIVAVADVADFTKYVAH